MVRNEKQLPLRFYAIHSFDSDIKTIQFHTDNSSTEEQTERQRREKNSSSEQFI